jgi:GNAT superfamily N-acetyltransferase
LPTELTVRPARPDEAEALRTLTVESKACWGYAPEVLREWGETLDIAAALREEGEAIVAEAGGRIEGWAQVRSPREGVCTLEHLWVAPGSMRAGIGTALFGHAAAAARAMGATAMAWEAEPNAAGFYAKMGGRTVTTVTSDWGRTIDVMAVEV